MSHSAENSHVHDIKSQPIRRVWRLSTQIVVTFATMLVVVLTQPTTASAQSGEFRLAEAAPPCFSVSQWDDWTWTGYRSYARADSHCRLTYRVRMIWNYDFDGECRTVLPGAGFTQWRQGKIPSVGELRLC